MQDNQSSTSPQDTNTDSVASATGSFPLDESTSSPTNTQNHDSPESAQNSNLTNNSQAQDVITAPHTPQKYGGKKIIATIFGIFVLIGGIAAGVLLVQRQQELREKAASGSACDHSPDCVLVDNAQNSGSRTVERSIAYVDITDKDYHRYEPGETDDGCRKVSISGNTVTWERYGDGPNCKDVSNVQIWMGQGEITPTETPKNTPTPTQPPCVTQPPSITAECSNVKAYDTNWNQLSQTQLGQLEAGTTIKFTVSGTASSGSFDKARFSVNSAGLGETALKKPGSDEFYIDYTLPTNTTSFNVSAQIHHSSIGWF